MCPGHGGTGSVAIRILWQRGDEALEDRVEDVVLRLAASELWVQRGRLGTVADE